MTIRTPAFLGRGLLVLALAALPGAALADPAGAGKASPSAAAEAPPSNAAPAPAAASGTPSASDLLFDRNQIKGTTPGQSLTYRYSRKVSDPELGESFDDHITLKVAAPAEGGGAEARDVVVDFFTGERHRAAGPFAGFTGNPVLILFLENHVRDLSARLKGNPRYFKSAIRAALRDSAKVTAMPVKVGDRTYEGWRIEVTPFKGDPNAQRMRGLDQLTYDFMVAPDLPGEIADIKITADAPAGRLYEEDLAYDPKGP